MKGVSSLYLEGAKWCPQWDGGRLKGFMELEAELNDIEDPFQSKILYTPTLSLTLTFLPWREVVFISHGVLWLSGF